MLPSVAGPITGAFAAFLPGLLRDEPVMSVAGCSMVHMAQVLAFTKDDLKGAAGARSFERGLDYLRDVEDLYVSPTQITAWVYGSSKYRVCLAFGDDDLSGSCTCPYGQEGFFCKHCVAVGLAVLEMGEDLPALIEATRAERHALESWLESLSKKDLLAELLGLLDEEPDLRRRFELRAASVNLDAVTVRHAVQELILLPRRGYVEYSEAHAYATDVHKAAAAIDDLTEAGGAADAIGIAREAVALLAEAFDCVDDSSGVVGEAAHELLAVHLRACEAAPPDPVSLGGYLAGLLLHSDHGFAPDLAGYVGLLGDEGFGAVRERIEAAYTRNPLDWHARSLMESLARAEGDVDALIAIYAAHLDDRGWNHLRIAEELDENGRGGEALVWAERGLAEAANPDQRLVDYLAGRYAAAGRDDDVLSLRRDRFRDERTLASYRALRSAAKDSGVWTAERAEAVALLGKEVRRPAARASWDREGPVLVDALIDDGDLDAAWEAAKDAASDAQWLRLADASAASRPTDALAVYMRAIAPLKSLTGDRVYHRMATLLLSARACHEALGTTDKFARYLAALRLDQKRKRNLIKILDQKGL
jgi:uncharacterized Zn finger protein